MKNNNRSLGILNDGIRYAQKIKNSYMHREPLTVVGAGKQQRLLMPEHLLSKDLALMQYDDPLALAVIATRDPESPMALAAAIRMGPQAKSKDVISGIFEVVSDSTKHELVHDCAKLLTRNSFSPEAFDLVRHKASAHLLEIREGYRLAMAQNLRLLLDGKIAAREFVEEFIELASHGNLRIDIYRRLVMKLMRSEAVRPSVKFMILERLDRFPQMVKLQIVKEVNSAPDTPEYQTLKQELRWIYESRMRASVIDKREELLATARGNDRVNNSMQLRAKELAMGLKMPSSDSGNSDAGKKDGRRRHSDPSLIQSGGFRSRDMASWLN